MFCSKCGNDVGDAKFCTKCGNKIVPVEKTKVEPVVSEPVKVEPVVSEPEAAQTQYQANGEAAPALKKKSKAPIIALVVVLVLAALAAATYFAWPAIKNKLGNAGGATEVFAEKPEDRANAALKSITAAMKIDTENVPQVTVSDKQQLKGSFTLTAASITGTNYLSEIKANTISYDIQTSTKDATISGKFGVGSSKDSTDLSVEFLMDATNIYFKIPELVSESFKVSTSEIFDSSSMSFSDMFTALQSSGSVDQSQMTIYLNSLNSALADITKCVDQFIDTMEFAEVEKGNYTIGSTTIDATKMQVTFTGENLKNTMTSIINEVYMDTAVAPYMGMLSFQGITKESLLKDINDMDFEDTYIFMMYLDKDNNIVKYEFQDTADEDNKVELTFSCKENMFDEIELTVSGDEPVTLVISKKADDKYFMKVSDDDTSIETDIVYSTSSTGSKAGFENFKMSSDESGAQMNIEGSYNVEQNSISSIQYTKANFADAIDAETMTELQQQTIILEGYGNIEVLKKIISDNLYNQLMTSLLGGSSSGV